MAFNSGADVSMPTFKPLEDILNIHRDKLAKTSVCNLLLRNYNLLLNETFVSDCW